MNYKEENDRLFNDFLSCYFWEPFRQGEQSIEFIISPRCNLNCFPAGTMIRMADYTEKRIEDIEVGDAVMGFPEYPSRSDPMRPQCSTVTTLLHSETFELIRFTFEDGTELVTTPDHPILVKSKCERSGRYRLAKKFKVGQEAVCIALPPLQDANDIGLVRLDWVVKLFGTKKICCIDYPKCYMPEPLYNLETTTHTYIANGVLVHNCDYCYISKYRGTTFPEAIYDNTNIINNLGKIVRWMDYNGFTCPIDIFSGEPLAQRIGYEVLDYIYDFYKDKPAERRPKHVVIPTNFSFIASDEWTARVEDLLDKYENIGMPLYLSASFDGKYMDSNRPYVHDLDIPLRAERDDAYYDKIFEFAKKHKCGFHPMIYYRGIDDWKRNFDWFQEMYVKHGIEWDNLYLLQVRNAGWTPEQNKSMYDFLRYLIDFAWDKCGHNYNKFACFMGEGQRGFNILSEIFNTCSRGIGCGMQASFGVRLSDMSHHICHRTMYPDLKLGELVDDPDTVLRYKTQNAELGLTAYGFSTSVQPACIRCPIKHLCIGGCLGAQYEANRDLFSPIQSVCQNSWWLVKAIVDGFEAIGVLDTWCEGLPKDKVREIEFVRSWKDL